MLSKDSILLCSLGAVPNIPRFTLVILPVGVIKMSDVEAVNAAPDLVTGSSECEVVNIKKLEASASSTVPDKLNCVGIIPLMLTLSPIEKLFSA